MIIKKIDNKDKQIIDLKNLLNESNNFKQKNLIRLDLEKLINGYEAEKANAYLLDFHFKSSKNVYVLHDLRIEHQGRVAQIDHLLITRLSIEILESKSFTGELFIKDNNSLEVKYQNMKKAFPNPLEQLNRHLLVLENLLKDNKILSNTIGMNLSLSTKVLIHPNTLVKNKTLPDGFVRADSFLSTRNKEFDNIGVLKTFNMLLKIQKLKNILKITDFLISEHKAIRFDYKKKFKITNPNIEKILQIGDKCPSCNIGELKARKTTKKEYKEKYNNNSFIGCSNYPQCRYIVK